MLATDLPPHYRQASSGKAYDGFAGQWHAGTVETLDGFTLHILGHKKLLGHMRMMELRKKLRELSPDIVQTMTPIGWIALDAACFRASLGYRLFTGCHHHASVFPLAARVTPLWDSERLACLTTRAIPGRLASFAAEKCYAITADCADVAARFFGVPRSQLEISPLGVDIELFHPIRDPREAAGRKSARERFGFSGCDIVCIYTGRFSEDKNPLLLARAVAQLHRQGQPYRALFVGNGPQAEAIRKCSGCATQPFEPVQELGAYFRAADIGVWPAQESLSMLDAAACGLPIVVNHTMTAPERIAGNGLTYRLNDSNDLIRALLELKKSSTRNEMGRIGSQKMAHDFSWEAVACSRLRDYEVAMNPDKAVMEPSAARPLPERSS